MNDDVRCVIPWDEELAECHRDLGFTIVYAPWEVVCAPERCKARIKLESRIRIDLLCYIPEHSVSPDGTGTSLVNLFTPDQQPDTTLGEEEVYRLARYLARSISVRRSADDDYV